MNLLADIIATIGVAAAETSSKGCFLAIFDEPECPQSLIK